MIFTEMEQRSDEWYAARKGRPTASEFDRLITGSGKLSDRHTTYAAELIAERIFGNRPDRQDISNLPAVRYGIDYEPEAKKTLATTLPGMPEILGGGWMTDDSERFGCSPDGRIETGNRAELVEIKCPEVTTHIKSLLFGLDEKYKAQVQGQLLISGYQCVHFFSYRHDCPPFYARVERDEPFLRALAKILDSFCNLLEVKERQLLDPTLGPWGTAP
jgi:hypothetical protein